MIPLSEIAERASEWQLPQATVEKDYVLGWLKAGHLSFVGWEREDNHIKRFRVDRIQVVELTGISFRPRYAVEF